VAAWVGGFALLAIVASVRGSPLHPPLAASAAPTGPFAALADSSGADELHGAALVALSVAAVILATGAFLWVLAEAWRDRIRLVVIVVVAVLAHVSILSLPLLVSRDAYSYAAYGRIAKGGLNPYTTTPAESELGDLSGLVSPRWAGTTSVYGPLFTGLTAWVASMADSASEEVALYRVIAAIASLGTLTLIAAMARVHRRERAAFAAAAFGLNPLVLFQSVGSGHNDLLVALAVAAGLALVLADRPTLSAVVLAAGALVKASSALPLLLLFVWVAARGPRGERVRAVAGPVGVSVALALAASLPYMQSEDPTLGMAELATHEGWLAPSRLIGRGMDFVSAGSLGWLARVAAAALLIVCLAILARVVWREAAVRADGLRLGAAWGWALILLMLLGPVLLPWYVIWTLPLLWLLPRVPRVVLIATGALLSLSQWAADPVNLPDAYGANVLVGRYLLAPVLLGLTLWVLLDGRRRLLDGLGPLDEETVRTAELWQ
jgi:hypothetical protein